MPMFFLDYLGRDACTGTGDGQLVQFVGYLAQVRAEVLRQHGHSFFVHGQPLALRITLDPRTYLVVAHSG